MGDVLNEATRHVPGAKPKKITAEAVSTAFENRRRRNSRVEDRMQEGIAEGMVMIDTDGEVIGQINALVVRDLGDHAFGSPSRVTARGFRRAARRH
jgi:predicted ATP-dependent protease